MRAYTDKEIIARVAALPTFTGWHDGVYDVWIRSKADEYDRFDDKVFTYLVDRGKPIFIMAGTGTTNAGSYGLLWFRKWNPDGCAVLKSDTIVYGSHVYGLHKSKPAYRQAKSWPYFRDGNRNKRAEEIGREREGVILANCHRAGIFSTIIYNWSVACLVRNQLGQFKKWLAYMIAQGKPPLNVAILKEF